MVFLQVVYRLLTLFDIKLEFTKSVVNVSYLLVNILVYGRLQLIGVDLSSTLSRRDGDVLNGSFEFV